MNQTEPTRPLIASDREVPAVVADQLVYLLARATGQVSAGLHRKIRAFGLSVPEYRTVMTLSDGPRAVGVLADLLLMKQPTLSRILDRLETAGHVLRQPDPADGRKSLALLSANGQTLANRLTPLSLDHDADILSAYSEGDAATLKEALRVLINRTSQKEGGA